MGKEQTNPHAALFLVIGAGLVTIARAMTLSFLAIKLQQTFGLGPATIGFLLGLGLLIGAVAAPFAGSVSDRVGRRIVLTLTLVSMAFAMIGMGLAETVFAFCLAQSAASVAISVYGPISRALMSDICAEPDRLKYFSWRYTASNVGWAVGPLIGVLAGIASTGLFIAAGALYATLAIGLQLLRLPRREHADCQASKQASLIESVIVAMHDRQLAFFISGSTLLIAVYGQWTATLAPYVTQNIASGVEIFAYLVSINGVVVLTGNPLARRFIERAGPLRALLVGCVLLGFGQVGFLVSTGLPGFAVSMVIFTAGEILVVPSEYTMVDRISPAQNRGSYFGAHSLSTVGGFLGPTIGGVTLGVFGGPAMFILFAGAAALGALCFTLGAQIQPQGCKSRNVFTSRER
ncbi:MFS transporter [Pararhizobium sp. PWRC1-1]|uniref:MFS transporter n=1 Tax=Pararhizobium sp. PWRC1-1 TaxID=2804566 RepID=UPI003CF4CDA3